MADRHLSPEEITAYLDGETELAEAQRAHLRDCSDCSRRHREALGLRRLARTTAGIVPTDEMWAKISERIGETPVPEAPRRTRWSLRFGLGLGSAAAAAAAVLLLVRNPEVRETQVPAGTPPAPAPPEPKPAGKAAAPARKAPVPRKAPSAPAGPLAAAPSADRPDSDARRADEAAGGGSPASAAPEAPTEARRRAAPAATASAVPRPVHRAAAFVLTADSIEAVTGGRIVAKGHVVVAPGVPGVPYVAVVDGFTRTVSGVLAAQSAEIRNPGERLAVSTGRTAPRAR